FSRLAEVHAVSEADGWRFGLLGVPRERVVVTGDPGVDSAAERVAAANPVAPHLRPFRGSRPPLSAGSTWPADETMLLPACRGARARLPGLQVVIAPHEPGPAHVSALLERLREDGWRPATLAEVEAAGTAETADAVVVDRVGVLAEL